MLTRLLSEKPSLFLQIIFYDKLAQKRIMRVQTSSSASVEVAYDALKYGDRPKASPCTAATPSCDKSAVTKSSSVLITAPSFVVLPMQPSMDG